MVVIGFFIYFGAFLIPLAFFASGKTRAARKGMLVGMALHAFWSLAVWGFVWYSWHAGYTDYYYGYALLIPVNVVAAVFYFGWLIWKNKDHHARTEGESV